MNLSALRDSLDGGALDARADAAIRAGSNAELLTLLHAEDGTLPRRWRSISVDDFLNVVAQVPNLTAAQEDRIRTYTLGRDRIAVHKPGVKAWIIANFPQPAVDAIRDLAEVPGRAIDTFLDPDEEQIGKREIRLVVAQIAKAHVNRPKTPDNDVRAALINEYGVKIRSLRPPAMTEEDYLAFRNSLYDIHGADQASTDTLRVDAINAKVQEVFG